MNLLNQHLSIVCFQYQLNLLQQREVCSHNYIKHGSKQFQQFQLAVLNLDHLIMYHF